MSLRPPWLARLYRFCSKKCYATNRARLFAEGYLVRTPKEVTVTICAFCGKEFSQDKSPSNRRTTCSEHCARRVGGMKMKGRSSLSPTTHRRRLKAARPPQCERCGYDKEPGILACHHDDENKQNGADDNLRWLCPNCHMEEHYARKTGPYKLHNRRSRKEIPGNLLSRNERTDAH